MCDGRGHPVMRIGELEVSVDPQGHSPSSRGNGGLHFWVRDKLSSWICPVWREASASPDKLWVNDLPSPAVAFIAGYVAATADTRSGRSTASRRYSLVEPEAGLSIGSRNIPRICRLFVWDSAPEPTSRTAKIITYIGKEGEAHMNGIASGTVLFQGATEPSIP